MIKKEKGAFYGVFFYYLSQLWDSDPRPSRYKGDALPAELSWRVRCYNYNMQVVISARQPKDLMSWRQDMFGKAWWQYLLTPVLASGCQDLLVITEAEDVALRQDLRVFALTQPICLRTLAQTQTPDFNHDLLLAAPYLAEEFIFFPLDNLNAVFQLEQLQQYHGDAVMAVDEKNNLLHAYKFQREWVEFLQQARPDLSWTSALAQFAQDWVVKAIPFTVAAPKKKLNLEQRWLSLLNDFFPNTAPILSCREKNLIAPTARIKGKVIIEDGAMVGEYSGIEGPVYLGKNSRVGNFCQLKNSCLEAESEVADYTGWENCYLAPKFIFAKNFVISKDQVFCPKIKPGLVKVKEVSV